MAREKKSIFIQRGNQKVNLAVKIDADLKDSVDKLQKELTQVAPHLKFDIPVIIENALRDAHAAGKAELTRLKQQHPAG